MALARGISHAEFLRTTSAREVAEYRALHRIDPLWDAERTEYAVAQLTNVYFNRNKSEEASPTTPLDWMPNYTAWLTAKSQAEESDEFDRWQAEQIAKGIIRGK
jgi:hypothetical protein